MVVKEAWEADVIGDPWWITSKLKKVKRAMTLLNHSVGNFCSIVEEAQS